MHLHYRNVNDALANLVGGFESSVFQSTYGPPPNVITCPVVHDTSRNGPVLRIEEPVTITYHRPLERVLFNQGRDANPFFHLVEALWMLAGRNDVAPLAYYASNIANYSDDGKTLHGAYGHRWRRYFTPHPDVPGIDQLETAIKILQTQTGTRRVVVQMWSPEDLVRVAEQPDCKDVPCNTEVLFSTREVEQRAGDKTGYALDMSVINRSNDMIWGALGSNYVHFSFLQEYVALACGFKVGRYHQISNNLHCYVYDPKVHKKMASNLYNPDVLLKDTKQWYPISGPLPNIIPLYIDRHIFDSDCRHLFSVIPEMHSSLSFQTTFFHRIVSPMLKAWRFHKDKDYRGAERFCLNIGQADWHVACQQWMDRRQPAFPGVA